MGTLFAPCSLSMWRIHNPEELLKTFENGGGVDGLGAPYGVSSFKGFLDVYFNEKTESCGLTPFSSPRSDFDDNMETVNGLTSRLMSFRDLESEELQGELGYTQWDYTQCKVTDGVYAFWLVNHEKKELDDLNSIKEAISYEQKKTPFRLLNGEDRKFVTEMTEDGGTSNDVLGMVRKQSIVIIDFNEKLMITEVVGKNQLEQFLGFMMTDLGMRIGPVAFNWGYKAMEYPQILTNIMEKLQTENDNEPLLTQLSDLRKNGTLEDFVKQYEEHRASSMALIDYPSFNSASVALYGNYSVMFPGSKKPVGVGEALDTFDLLKDYPNTNLTGGLIEFKTRAGAADPGEKKKRYHHYYLDLSRAPIAGIPSFALYKFETDGPTQTQLKHCIDMYGDELKAYWMFYLTTLYKFLTCYYGRFVVEHVLEGSDYKDTIEALIVNVQAATTDINAAAE